MYMAQSPCFLSPLANSPLLPFLTPLYLLGNPPSCDRIRPPWSLVACKLYSPFPSPCPYTPSSKIPTSRGFSHPNIHSLGWHHEPGSQDPLHSQNIILSFKLLKSYMRLSYQEYGHVSMWLIFALYFIQNNLW